MLAVGFDKPAHLVLVGLGLVLQPPCRRHWVLTRSAGDRICDCEPPSCRQGAGREPPQLMTWIVSWACWTLQKPGLTAHAKMVAVASAVPFFRALLT